MAAAAFTSLSSAVATQAATRRASTTTIASVARPAFTSRASLPTGSLKAGVSPFAGRAAGLSNSFSRRSARTAAAPVTASSDAPVALVTGSSRGIGLAIALELASKGCKVVLNAFSEGALADAAEQCKAAGAPEVLTIAADVSKKESVDAMIAKVVAEMGSLDIMVNNAGITRDTLILRMKPEQWQQVIDINLTGVFYCSQAAAKVMSKKRKGRIINISSVVGQTGNAGQANYSAAKGGVIAMTKTFAREFASRGVTINAIAPGFIKSDMTAAIDPKYEGAILAQIPLGRMGEASEVAGMVRFLAVEDAALYITGQTFNVDGGMAMV